MSLAIDHVILCARDLDAAARELFEAHGLASIPGGRHQGHGTGNRIVPLGDGYVELIGVVDADEAAASPMGRWVRDAVARGDRLLALCLRTGDVDALGARLGLEPLPMSRARPSGAVLSWRLAGLDRAMGPERLPFFIAWVELGGDAARIREWLGPHDLALRLAGGPPGPRAVGIRTAAGEIVLK